MDRDDEGRGAAMTDIAEIMARAIRDEAKTFGSPVRLYVEDEARERWEKVNPDGEWYDGTRTEEQEYLASWAILSNAALTALQERGFVVVPVLPTEEMLAAAATNGSKGAYRMIYTTMLDAATEQAGEQKPSPVTAR